MLSFQWFWQQPFRQALLCKANGEIAVTQQNPIFKLALPALRVQSLDSSTRLSALNSPTGISYPIWFYLPQQCFELLSQI